MTKSLVEAAGSFLESRTSRRSFLTRAALTGSALTVAPVRYLLRPGTAYATICGCANQNCDCGSACCDGYTEFCCTLTGANACPSGTFTGGWWKADGTAFCSADSSAPRYYIDCNILPGSGCGCECAGGDCNNRRTCCNVFRYGQCHQEIGEVTAIKCRVVTCTPPWQLDAACTSASLTDQSTADHDAACLHRPPNLRSLPAVARGSKFYARASLTTGTADVATQFGDGPPGDFPIMGDWNGDGTKTPGVVRGNTWFLKNSFSGGAADIAFAYGNGTPGDFPVVGDWTGSGTDTAGVVRNGLWLLKSTPGGGAADISFFFGDAGDRPLRWAQR